MKSEFDRRYLAGGLILLMIAVFSYLVRFQGNLYLVEENEAMEHIQLAFIFIAGFFFWRNTGQSLLKNNPALQQPVKRLAMIAAILCFSFLIREMSVKKSGIDWLIYIVDGTGFKILMLALWLPALYSLARSWSCYWSIARNSILTPTAKFTMAAAGFMLAGALYDKEIIVVEYFRFYEEIFEMTGYGFLILAALSFAKDMEFSQADSRLCAASSH